MAYSSNLNTVIKNVKNNLNGLPIEQITIALGNSLLADNIERIHQQGKSVSGSNIGFYDTSSPMYINPNSSPRANKNKIKGIQGLKPPKGKHGNTKFKNGKLHKTTYVNNYKDFRNKIGRRTDKVDLNLTGKLQAELIIEAKGNKCDLGFISNYGSTVSKSLEKKYSKRIWGASKEEKQTLKKVAIEEINNFLNDNN